MNYHEILSEKFKERKRVNPRYSLRAFAKDLKISPSRLSDVLANKGKLSVSKGRVIAKCLHLAPLAAADFIDMIEASGRGAQSCRVAAAQRLQLRRELGTVRTLSADEFSVVSDWRYLAVWSFMTLPRFDGRRQTIARHFKMNMIEVEDILRRLERLKMVTVRGKNGVIGSTQLYTGGSIPQNEIRQFHTQMSLLGKASIESQGFSERHLESAILTIDRSRFGEIEQHVANFGRFLVKEYSDQPTNDAVYGFSLQLFKIAEPIQN